MTEFWLAAAGWAGHTALTGGLLLLLGWVAVRLVRAPAARHRLAAWVVRAAVLVPGLCLLPAWLTVPVPEWLTAVRVTPVPAAPAPPAVAAVEPASAEPFEPDPDRGEDVAWMPDRDAHRRAAADLPGGVWHTAPPPDRAVPDVPPLAVWVPGRADGEPLRVAEKVPDRAQRPEIPRKPDGGLRRPAPPPLPAPAESAVVEAAPYVLVPYWGIAALLLGQLLLGHAVLRRWRLRGEPAPARVQAVFDELAVGFPAPPTLRVSDRIASPAAFGLLRATVLLPKPLAVAGTTAELRWVFAHELDHLRRGDHLTGWWVGAARAAYFFVPWFWPLRKELGLSQEYLADAAAAAAGGSPVDYAAFLVSLSAGPKERRPARPPLPATGVRAGKSDLFRRVTMLLNPQSAAGRRVSRSWSVLTAAGTLSAAVLLSGLGVAVADDEKPKPKPKVKVVAAGDEEKVQDKKKKVEAEEKEKKVQKDGDKPKAGTKDGDKPKTGPKDGEREAQRAEEIARLKKQIAAAAKAGETDEMQKHIDQLTKLLLAERERDRDRGDQPRRPVPPVPPEFGRVNEEQLRKALEKSMEGFEKAMEKLKDNPDAQDQLKKAMEAYRKAMEDGLKKGVWAVPGVPGVEGFKVPRFEGGDFRFEGFGPREGAFFAGRPRLGVSVGSVPEALSDQLDLKGRGVLITGVVPGTPAEKAGLKKNDVVLTFAGKDVAGPEAFTELVAAAKAEKVNLTVLRKGKQVELSGVTLADPKKADEPAKPAKPAKPAEPTKPGRPAEPRRPTKPGAEAGGKKVSFDSTSITIKDGEFRIKAEKDDVTYEVTGEIDGGKAVPTSIVIRADGETIKEKSVEKLPKDHQAAVKELLGSIGVAK